MTVAVAVVALIVAAALGFVGALLALRVIEDEERTAWWASEETAAWWDEEASS